MSIKDRIAKLEDKITEYHNNQGILSMQVAEIHREHIERIKQIMNICDKLESRIFNLEGDRESLSRERQELQVLMRAYKKDLESWNIRVIA